MIRKAKGQKGRAEARSDRQTGRTGSKMPRNNYRSRKILKEDVANAIDEYLKKNENIGRVPSVMRYLREELRSTFATIADVIESEYAFFADRFYFDAASESAIRFSLNESRRTFLFLQGSYRTFVRRNDRARHA